MKPDNRKSLPGTKAGNILDTLRESVQTYLGLQGDKLDRGITVRDLANAGLIDVSKTYLAGGSRNPIGRVNTVIGTPGSGGTIVVGGDTYEPDLTPPPSPSGFTVGAGISYLYIECANQVYTVGHGHGTTKLYGAKRTGGPVPTFSDAVLLSTFGGTVYAYPTDPNTTWHLWITWVTKDGVESPAPAGGTNGLVAVTGQDVRLLFDALTAAATNPTSPYSRVTFRATQFYVASDLDPAAAPMFSVVTSPITLNGVAVPVGVYLREAFIQNGTITNLKVANGAIDNLKVANVSADKITAGTIAIGQYIQSTNYVAGQSGWKINGIGNVEFNSAVFRGSAFVGNGSVGGILVAPDYIQSSNYNGTGTGFRLGADGTLDLPGGSVNAQQLNVGNGANLLNNSTWIDRGGQNAAIPIGWATGNAESVPQFYRSPVSFPTWCPPSAQGLVMEASNGPIANAYMLAQCSFPAIPGRRYEAHALNGSHRCNCYVDIQWFDGNQASLGTSSDNQVTNDNGLNVGLGGGTRFDQFKKVGCFGVAPSTASYGVIRLIKGQTSAGQTSSYGFWLQPFVGLARTKQTAFSDYSPSGVGTVITPGGISTPSLAALNAILGDCYAGSLRGGSYTGYGWPTNGDGGFYLGPNGLLLGNYNTGQYFQVDRGGNLYAPGFYVQNGVMTVYAANIIGTAQIQGGAVTTMAWARGVQLAQVGISVPAGEVHYVHCTASWQARQGFPNQYIGPSVFTLTGVPDQSVIPTTYTQDGNGGDSGGFGPTTWTVPPVTMTSLLALGPGYYIVTANTNSGCDATLVCSIARRP